jgi:parvulin-like peptidyl-prolyl isomerase
MQFRFSVLILLSLISYVHSVAVAQQTQPNAPAVTGSTAAETSESRVAPDAAVITIHGLCGNVSLPGSGPETFGSQSAKGASDASAAPTTPNPNCETAITRQQFENLVRGISPRSDPRLGASFARDYPETLVFARKAVEAGLDKDPAFQALLEYKYQQALYSIFKTYVKQKANAESDAELEKFYYANRDRYEQFGILRIHVPNVKQHHPVAGSRVQPKVDVAADEAAMKAVAIKIRAEAVAGGNFELLQAKAYKLAGETDDPPDTDLGDQWTRDTFPAENLAVVLALKPGQVSEPIHNASGWHILKLVSRKTIPLSEARDSTLQMIVGDEANSTRRAIKTELNDQYFVSAGSPQAKAPLK